MQIIIRLHKILVWKKSLTVFICNKQTNKFYLNILRALKFHGKVDREAF